MMANVEPPQLIIPQQSPSLVSPSKPEQGAQPKQTQHSPKFQSAELERRKLWLVDVDEAEKLDKEQEWSVGHKAKIKKIKKEVENKMKMYHASASWAESRRDWYTTFQLIFGGCATILAFINASQVPSMIGVDQGVSTSDVVSVLSVIIGILSIISTGIAEKLKRQNYAVNADRYERTRVDYQCVLDMMRSEVAFNKMKAMTLEAKIRRILQDLEYAYQEIHPPAHIKAKFFDMHADDEEPSCCSRLHVFCCGKNIELEKAKAAANCAKDKAAGVKAEECKPGKAKVHSRASKIYIKTIELNETREQNAEDLKDKGFGWFKRTRILWSARRKYNQFQLEDEQDAVQKLKDDRIALDEQQREINEQQEAINEQMEKLDAEKAKREIDAEKADRREIDAEKADRREIDAEKEDRREIDAETEEQQDAMNEQKGKEREMQEKETEMKEKENDMMEKEEQMKNKTEKLREMETKMNQRMADMEDQVQKAYEANQAGSAKLAEDRRRFSMTRKKVAEKVKMEKHLLQAEKQRISELQSGDENVVRNPSTTTEQLQRDLVDGELREPVPQSAPQSLPAIDTNDVTDQQRDPVPFY